MTRSDPRLLVLSPVFHGYWRSIERAFTALGYAVTTVAYDAHPGPGRPGPGQGRARPASNGSAGRRRTPPRASRPPARSRRCATLDPDVVLVVKGDTFDDGLWQPRRRAGAARCGCTTSCGAPPTPEPRSPRPGPVATYSPRRRRDPHRPRAAPRSTCPWPTTPRCRVRPRAQRRGRLRRRPLPEPRVDCSTELRRRRRPRARLRSRLVGPPRRPAAHLAAAPAPRCPPAATSPAPTPTP